MSRILVYAIITMLLMGAASAQTGEPQVRNVFQVRYTAGESVYLDAGANAGLAEGMKLVVKQSPAEAASKSNSKEAYQVATLVVDAVAETSAVCTILTRTRELVRGDSATLSREDTEKLIAKTALSNTRKYPAVVSFTEGDPLDEDVRESIPRPPLPEVNRAVGRIGLDYTGTSSSGSSSLQSSNVGAVFRADITRIGGTYWNLSGYWRGRLASRSSSAQPTIQDLINRTYHISMMYTNPNSNWVAGFGRMYLPWASSLETIDGGFVGRRFGSVTTAGIFAGSTPDPSSWSYDPNRRMGGAFVNFTTGSYEKLRLSSTLGAGVTTMVWTIDRPFVFAENSVSYGQKMAVYHSFQVDKPRVDPSLPQLAVGVSRSFLTVHYQAHRRVSLDLNHNYFRDVPTYDPQLVGTGLLDKYLFQGLSGGARVELPAQVSVYTSIGRSSNSTDPKSSWNQMYGVTLNKIWRTHLRVDARYSKFDSAFAKGNYRAVSISRNFGQDFRWEFQVGQQSFFSSITQDNGTKFVGSNIDFSLGGHYFIQSGFNLERGSSQNYRQLFTTFGYRFDNRTKHKEAPDANGN
jgi:hypothetical protein